MRCGVVAMLASTAALVGAVLWRTGGTFVYTLDDPAIHLTIARRLAFDGTWGVVAGEYQAASSSPLWVALLAPTQWFLPGRVGELAPILLNLIAAVGVLWLLGPDLAQLNRLGRHSRAATMAAVAVVLLFLPGLTMTGMEHVLHMAIVLGAAIATERRYCSAEVTRWPWLPFALVLLATLTRGESAFVAFGLAVGILVMSTRPIGRRLLVGIGIGLASLAGFATVAAMNLAFGQEPLPNPVVRKGRLGTDGRLDRSLAGSWERLWTDRLVVVILLTALSVIVIAILRRDKPPSRELLFPAIVVAVAGTLHVAFAAIDGEGRYEAYLLGLGTWMFLRAFPAVADRLPRRSWLTAGAAIILLASFAPLQVRRTASVPDRADELFEQRYQVARFLHDAYQNEPIAIGELGYIGLYHDGPLTDVYGLGDHDVLRAWMDDRTDASFWRQLQKERDFKVAVVFDFTLSEQRPDDWTTVATWRSPDAYYQVTEFRATTSEEVEPLREALLDYESRLPGDIEVAYNPLAGFAASSG